MTGFRNAKWLRSPASIGAEIEVIMKTLNPDMKDLVDMQGGDFEVRGKARYAKMSLSDNKPYRLAADSGAELIGDLAPVPRVLPGAFELTSLFLFGDGLAHLGSNSKLYPIEHLKALYDQGIISNAAPAGSKIIIPGLGSFETTQDFGYVSQSDRILEINDQLRVLPGDPGVVALCRQVWADYENAPSDEKKELLRVAYERVPTHLQCYCGDMDTRDTKICKVLYGENSDQK